MAPDPGVQLRPAHRLLPPVARRHRVPQHLPHRLASQPELPGRLAFAHLVDDDRSPNPRIQLHCVHLSGVPQNISLWECSMEPVSWRSSFAPPATPLTRRLLVYFGSGAYTHEMFALLATQPDMGWSPKLKHCDLRTPPLSGQRELRQDLDLVSTARKRNRNPQSHSRLPKSPKAVSGRRNR